MRATPEPVSVAFSVTLTGLVVNQPTQLALNKTDTRLAEAAPAPAPQPQIAEAISVPQPPVAEPAPTPAPVVAALAEQAPPPPVNVAMATAAPGARPAYVAPKPARAPKPKPAKVQHAATPAQHAPIRQAALRRGNSTTVVQLGSFSNPKSVLAAWNAVAHHYSALRGYAPMSARFASTRGTLYRLSVHGFASVSEASALCASLRRSGGTCFVRNVAGDAPVQIASR